MKPFYITTPIYYVNDRPHIGHAYTTTVADTLARFHHLLGTSVFLSVGVDENSQKNVQAMEKAGEQDLQIYLDRMAGVWKNTWDQFGIAYDGFIRTTESRHLAGVHRFWQAVKASGDIYEGLYEGIYCVGCESYKVESDLINARCPLHPNKELETIKEKNYFFRASAYRDALLQHLDAHPEFVQPETRRNEVRNYIANHLEDVSISREAAHLNVGIPVPDDPSARIYVWFDALLNYLTQVGYGTDDATFKHWWPTSIHIEGKDIVKFHCALFPAMLMSAAKIDPSLQDAEGRAALPAQIFNHGFFTIEGTKISKSLGNAIDPLDLIPTYGIDALRYFLLREIPFGEDGDFSSARLRERYTHDLANTLGNLVHRTISMTRSYFEGCIPTPIIPHSTFLIHHSSFTFCGPEGATELVASVKSHLQNLRIDLALETIWNGVDGRFGLLQANKFIEDTQPFKLIKTDRDAAASALYSLLEYLRVIAWLIEPMMPHIAKDLLNHLGCDVEQDRSRGFAALTSWGDLKPGVPLPQPNVLFPPLT